MKKTTIMHSIVMFLLVGGCTDAESPHDGHDHNHSLPTSAILNFMPVGGGETLSFEWTLSEGESDPQVDEIVLDDSVVDYDVSVEVWSNHDGEEEDLTAEILEGDAFHQFFFTGSAVQGPATGDNASAVLGHQYADVDENDLPVGLLNSVQVLGVGEGELHLMLRHLPPENDEAVKVAGMAETVAEVGFSGIGGDVDIEVSFPVTVAEPMAGN